MIRVEPREHGILVVTIDRPERRNALDPQTVAELHAVIESIEEIPRFVWWSSPPSAHPFVREPI